MKNYQSQKRMKISNKELTKKKIKKLVDKKKSMCYRVHIEAKASQRISLGCLCFFYKKISNLNGGKNYDGSKKITGGIRKFGFWR